jgi:hypothetical protein
MISMILRITDGHPVALLLSDDCQMVQKQFRLSV